MSLRLGGLEAWRLGVDICQLMTKRYVRNTLIAGLDTEQGKHWTQPGENSVHSVTWPEI